MGIQYALIVLNFVYNCIVTVLFLYLSLYYNTTSAVVPLFSCFIMDLDILWTYKWNYIYINYVVKIYLDIFSCQHIEQLEGYIQINYWI